MFGKARLRSGIIAAFSVALAPFFSAPAAHADDFHFNITDWHSFYVSTSADFGGYDHELDLGGNMNAVLNGETLLGSYCIGLLDPVYNGVDYPVSVVTKNAIVYGSPIANAEKISWLLEHFAATATTVDEQNALQAAIWRTQNGIKFELDGADNNKTGNSDALISNYKSYLSQLGNNTGNVADVLWISPQDSIGSTTRYQGIAGIRASGTFQQQSIPEPGALPLLVSGIALTGAAIRRRR